MKRLAKLRSTVGLGVRYRWPSFLRGLLLPKEVGPPVTPSEIRRSVARSSPLIPMQSTEAVHMGLVWKKNSATPKILFHSRFSEYTPNDVADPEIIDLAIARGAFHNPRTPVSTRP